MLESRSITSTGTTIISYVRYRYCTGVVRSRLSRPNSTCIKAQLFRLSVLIV